MLVPFRSSGRPLIRLVAVCLLLSGLAACSGQRDIPDEYTQGTEDHFVEGCVQKMTREVGEGPAASSDDAKAICQCSYDGISDPQDGIPFDEFKQINEDLDEEPGPLPASIRKIVDECKDKETAPA